MYAETRTSSWLKVLPNISQSMTASARLAKIFGEGFTALKNMVNSQVLQSLQNSGNLHILISVSLLLPNSFVFVSILTAKSYVIYDWPQLTVLLPISHDEFDNWEFFLWFRPFLFFCGFSSSSTKDGFNLQVVAGEKSCINKQD